MILVLMKKKKLVQDQSLQTYQLKIGVQIRLWSRPFIKTLLYLYAPKLNIHIFIGHTDLSKDSGHHGKWLEIARILLSLILPWLLIHIWSDLKFLCYWMRELLCMLGKMISTAFLTGMEGLVTFRQLLIPPRLFTKWLMMYLMECCKCLLGARMDLSITYHKLLVTR